MNKDKNVVVKKSVEGSSSKETVCSVCPGTEKNSLDVNQGSEPSFGNKTPVTSGVGSLGMLGDYSSSGDSDS